MNKFALRDFTDGIDAAMRAPKEIRTVSVFCNPLRDVKQRVRVSWRGKNELLVTFGKPNYAEREFLRKCKRAKCLPRRIYMEK